MINKFDDVTYCEKHKIKFYYLLYNNIIYYLLYFII